MKSFLLLLALGSSLFALSSCTQEASDRFWWPFGGPPNNPFHEAPPQGDAYSINGSPGSGS